MPVLNPPENLEVHDNTMLSWHAKCPFLYWIRAVQGLSPRRASQALDFGSLIHDGLAKFYECLQHDREDFVTALRQAIDVVESADYEDPIDGHRTRGRALLVLAQYVDHYRSDSDFSELIFTETPFKIVDDNGFAYGGRIDLIVRGYGNRIWVVDHKTSSYFGATYFDQFKSSPQFCGYTWAGSQLHGEQLAGVVVNNITIRKSGKTEFHRQPMRFPEWMVHEWYDDTIKRLNEVKRDIDLDFFERRRYNCHDKWGKCEAWNVCHGLPENTQQLINMEFIEKKWDWNDPSAKE